MKPSPTPLARALLENSHQQRPTPLTAFRLARRWWLKGKRLNLSAMAKELGVTRVTLMRWVGTREMLLGEVLWSLYREMLDRHRPLAQQQAGEDPVAFLVGLYHAINVELLASGPLQNFLRQDPRFALQVLTSNVSPLPRRLVALWQALLDEETSAGRIKPRMDNNHLAYFIVQLGESTVYSDLICGQQPQLEPGNMAVRLLLSPHPAP